LERRGLLESTLVIVTSDNGMPFPRAKGSLYEISAHMPLAAMWPRGIRAPGRTVTDYVSFVDFAPTFLEVADKSWEDSGMSPSSGRSLTDIFASASAGRVNLARDRVLLGMERHITGRPNNWGYPIRGIVQDGWLYLRNYEPSRWPTGNPEAGYLNVDASPTKTAILNARRRDPGDPHWALCFGKRSAEELYDLAQDPDCLINLAECPERLERVVRMVAVMEDELRAQDDPRMSGHGGVFEAEPIARPELIDLYERLMRGEAIKIPWVDPSDFEPAPLDAAQEE
jgi:arylsulfatase A-like enzyme